MLKVHTLSGYEGAGKSTIINHFKENIGYAVIPETARLIMPLEKTVLKDSKDDLSYKSFISYLTNMHFMLTNNLSLNVISDRNIIDSLTYLELYSKDQRIDLTETGDFIEKFLEEYGRETLYDKSILIQHPTDDEYIEKQILSDPERKYATSVKQYKEDAKIWEDIYVNIAESLINRRLSKKLDIIEAYPANPDIILQTEFLITGKLPKISNVRKLKAS